MSLRVKKKRGGNVPPMEAGTYPAVCVGVVDLGEQYSETFRKYSDRALLIWEIPSERVEIDGEEKPRWLSRDFAASLHEKSNLYKTLVSWRGRAFTEAELETDEAGFTAFSLKDMLGTGCLLQVIVEEKEAKRWNRITSVVALPAGMDTPQPCTQPFVFDMDTWDAEAFEALPEWIRERIQKSTQYKKLHVPTEAVDVDLGERGEANPI